MKRVKKTHILFALAASAILAGCTDTEVRQDQSGLEAPNLSVLGNVNI